MSNHIGERIQAILSKGPSSKEEEFLLEQAYLICRFRKTHREIREETDEEKRKEKEKKRSFLTDEIVKNEDFGNERLGIDRTDLRFLIDYVVGLDQENNLQELFEKVEERIEKIGGRKKQKKY